MTEWVKEPSIPGSHHDIEHRGGVWWADAPKPRRWHRCTAQTRGWVVLDYVERCACGAIRSSTRGRWAERNSR